MPFTYRLRVTNTGDFPFSSLRLTDRLYSDEFHYIVGSGSPADPDTIAEPDLVWDDLVPLIGGDLLPDQSITVSYQVTTTATNGTYTNTAVVEGTYDGGTLTDEDEAVVAIADPAVAIDKQLFAADRDDVAPNYVTFTIAIDNVGPSTIDVLPLDDEYETYYLKFVDATPYPNEDANDGLVSWADLTGPAPYGFGRNLLPGETVVITTVFRVEHDIDFTINTATVTGAVDVYGNPADPVEDEEPLGGIPTSIQVVSFEAVADDSAVRLEWETVDEWDCASFRIYRDLHARRNDETPMIAELPATGPGSTYQYVDRDVAPSQVYWYWLAQVSASQPERETIYGPVWGGVGPDVAPIRLYLPLVQKHLGEHPVPEPG